MFVEVCFFRAKLSKSQLLSFIASTPDNVYLLFIPNDGSPVYGCLYAQDVDYLLNEFIVDQFFVITPAEVRKALNSRPCRKCGNDGFLYLT